MWPFVTRSHQRAGARRTPVRGSRRYALDCTPLEDRWLLSVTLTESAPAVPYVGSPVVLTATTSGLGATPVYQFSVAYDGGPLQIVSDFSTTSSFTWNPMQQGTYEIQVVAKHGFKAASGETATAMYTAQTRVTGNSAVVSPMSNPLVALFSAPPSTGSSMYVQFAQQSSNPSWQDTSSLPIVPGESTNFIVAGMLADTTYLMRYVTDDGTVSAPMSFTTGSIPSNLHFPVFSVKQAPAAGTDQNEDLIFHAGVEPSLINTVATDLNGNIVWYYDSVANDFPGYAQNLEPGGTVMMLGGKSVGSTAGYTTLRQIDLAGDTLRQTDIQAINAQLAVLHKPRIIDFDHEAKLLPNGDTAVIASTKKTVEYHGQPKVFVGDMVLVLNQDLQVTWTWDGFKWLNTNRIGAVAGTPKNWLHANSISWSPEDDDLLVSLRSQSWVLKIDYADGTGNGHIIWKLGAGGNFKAIANTRQPWFSGQHDAHYINDNTILLFDDGNTRHAVDHGGDSRGQEWVLNEQNMTATLVFNADLGNYSGFLGSAQLLDDGNFAFTSGAFGPGSAPSGDSIEVLPNGTIVYQMEMGEYEYRSFFENTLYSASILDD